MEKSIAVATDTNSGIMQEEAEQLGVHVVPMPFVVDGEECFEGVNLDAERFYARQTAGADIVTSQPSIVDLGKRWAELLEAYDEVIYIPMSSGLSGSCETACQVARHCNGRVHVVDNQRISVTQREAVLDALRWIGEGRTAAETCALLERTKLDASIYLRWIRWPTCRRAGVSRRLPRPSAPCSRSSRCCRSKARSSMPSRLPSLPRPRSAPWSRRSRATCRIASAARAACTSTWRPRTASPPTRSPSTRVGLQVAELPILAIFRHRRRRGFLFYGLSAR